MWRFKQFKKQGGFQFLMNMYTTKTLFYALSIFPFFSGSKKSLEIFRLAIANRTYRYISRKFKGTKVTYKFADTSMEKIAQNKNAIWFMWQQGMENAPRLVKYNLAVLQKRFGKDRVKVITEKNLFDYIELPEFIKTKIEKKIISPTHFSDIVRIQLLATYGGMWVDSTLLFSGDLPEVIYNQSFFVPQTLKPGRDGKAIPVSNWLIVSKSNSDIVNRMRDLLFYYWEIYDRSVDYFIFHHLLMLVFDEFLSEFQDMIVYDNTQPHALLIAMKTKKMDTKEIKEYMQLSPIHKLTNKLDTAFEEENQKKLIEFVKDELINDNDK